MKGNFHQYGVKELAVISQKAFSVMAVPLVVGLCSIASAAKKMGFGLILNN